MHIISRKKLKEAVARYSDAEAALDVWFRAAKHSLWRDLTDVRRTFATADTFEKWTIFNIRGNKYRLITEINYRFHRVYVRHVLSHAEYDREKWKI